MIGVARLRLGWSKIVDSLWFIPGSLTAGAVALALLLVAADRAGMTERITQAHWMLHGGPEGARVVLSSIAGSLMTVTGVVFSIIIVALQLASSQFTPRVLGEFTSDRAIQFVLGIFIGTFTYTLIVLRAVRSETGTEAAFVPSFAVSVAMLLATVSIGALIFLINHAARIIQIAVIIHRVRRFTLRHIDKLFPEPVGAPAPEPVLKVPQTDPATVPSRAAGYLQAVDEDALFEEAEGRHILIRMEPLVGDFILPGEPLVSVWPPSAADEDLRASVYRAFVVGEERTPEQDVEFGLIELSDIAVKALSPGINDPSTAMACIDWLGELLVALGQRRPPSPVRTGREGELRFIANRAPYERAVALAFGQIRHYGASNPALLRKLLDTLARIAALVPEERRAPLEGQIDAIHRDAETELDNPRELRTVQRVENETRLKIARSDGRASAQRGLPEQ